jgi:hypothetical protein
VPTGKFEGTADGVRVEVDDAEGMSVSVVGLGSVSLPAGVAPPVVVVGAVDELRMVC